MFLFFIFTLPCFLLPTWACIFIKMLFRYPSIRSIPAEPGHNSLLWSKAKQEEETMLNIHPNISCFRNTFPEHKPLLPVRWRFPVVWVWGGVCWKLDGPSECKRRILLHSAAGTELSPHYLQHRAHYSLYYSTAYFVHCTSIGQVSLSSSPALLQIHGFIML